MSRYYAVMFGKFFGAVPKFDLVGNIGWNKVAILDMSTLLCYWRKGRFQVPNNNYSALVVEDLTNVNGGLVYADSGVEGLKYVSSKFVKNNYGKKCFFNAGFAVERTGPSSCRICIGQKDYELRLLGASLLWNGFCVVQDALLCYSAFDLAMVCSSDEGIYRLMFHITKKRRDSLFLSIEDMYLNLWLDIENGIILSYAWGLGLEGGLQPVVDVPVAFRRKLDRLASRIARSVMMVGEGRIY